MAAAADRLVGEVFERVSPELVLVDAALSEEMRRRLGVPEDTLGRIGRIRIDPRLSIRVAEVEVDGERKAEDNAFAWGERISVPATALEVAHHDAGIEDLIVIPEDGLSSVPPTILMVSDEGVTRRVPEREEIVAAPSSELDDVIVVVPAEDRAQLQTTRQSYPALPSPASDADEEDATEVVLRQIRDHIEPETPQKRRRRFLIFVSLFAALSSIAISVAQLQLGVSELTHWLPS